MSNDLADPIELPNRFSEEFHFAMGLVRKLSGEDVTIVPLEPTSAMIRSAAACGVPRQTALVLWRAMIQAAAEGTDHLVV